MRLLSFKSTVYTKLNFVKKTKFWAGKVILQNHEWLQKLNYLQIWK